MSEPTEIRRSGDQRRRTRRGVIAVVGIAVVLITGVGVAFGTGLVGGDDSATEFRGTPSGAPTSQPSEQPTGSPTTTPEQSTQPPSSAAISDANLPSGQEIYRESPGDLGEPLIQDGLTTASGEDRLFICERDDNNPNDQGLAGLPGLMDARSAIFSAADGPSSRAHVMQFDSPDKATAAADTMRGWVDDCANRTTGFSGAPVKASNEDTVTVDGARIDFSVQLRPIDEETGAWNGMLVITTGDRVLVVGDFVVGQDYNSVGPAAHEEHPDLPLVPTARELSTIIERLKG